MYPVIERRFTSNARIKQLSDAYETLFGVRPWVSLRGTWKTDRDELVFFNLSASDPVYRIGREYITVIVDGVKLRVKGGLDSHFKLYAQVRNDHRRNHPGRSSDHHCVGVHSVWPARKGGVCGD